MQEGGSLHSRFEEETIDLRKMSLLSPAQMGAWHNFLERSEKAFTLDLKFRELISIALSIITKDNKGITHHIKKAQNLGVSRKEIIEAGWLAILMGGDPLMKYLHHLYDHLEESNEIYNKDRRVQVSLALDSEAQKLHEHLIDYLKCACNEVEFMCKDNVERRKLALKIAELDGSILSQLIEKECRKRGWIESEV